jgi:tetratricopeptide (TPR) repeat protein
VDLLANALLIQGGVIESDYDYAGASALLEYSLALDTLTEPKLTTARIHHMLAWLALKQGDYERSNLLGYQALYIVRTLAHVEEHERRPMEAYVLAQLGTNAFFSAELARSERLTMQARALFAELGEIRYLAYMALNLGRVALYAGEYERADVIIHKSLAQLRDIDDIDGVAQTLYEVGMVALRKGNLDQAQQAFQEGIACLRHSGLLRRFIYPMRGLAEVTRQRGQTVLAAQLLGALEMIRQSIKAPIHPVFAPDFQATLAGVRTQLDEDTFATIYTTGCSMTPEEAVAFALANMSG